MRKVGVRPTESQPTATSGSALPPCGYAVGERVEHPKFGVGTIERIEPLSTDHKLVVAFDKYGSKTLLAQYAKLAKR